MKISNLTAREVYDARRQIKVVMDHNVYKKKKERKKDVFLNQLRN